MSWGFGDLPKPTRIESKRYRDGARGQLCTMQSSWCNHDPKTVVFAHADWSEAGKGKGLKAHDLFGADLCEGCHRWLHQSNAPFETKKARMQAAIFATQLRRIGQELLVMVGHNDKKVSKRG